MSNRLWAEHVKKPGLWKRVPLIIKVVLILSLVVGGVYGAIQVLFTQNGIIKVVGTGFIVHISGSSGFTLNVTNPATQYQQIRQNGISWNVTNNGEVPLTIRYFTNITANMTLFMFMTGGQNLQGQTLIPRVPAIGYFNLTVGHLSTNNDVPFTLTIEGCYPVGLC